MIFVFLWYFVKKKTLSLNLGPLRGSNHYTLTEKAVDYLLFKEL